MKKTIKNKKLNAIAILGGGMKKEKGRWRTLNFDDQGDKFGVSGDRLRVIAGAFLFRDNENLLIIASGGKGQMKNIKDAPTLSKLLKKELLKLNVSRKNIVEEKKSGNTYEQLIETGKIIIAKNIKSTGVISNKYHLPRVKAMIRLKPELNFLRKKIKLISAEQILLKKESQKWKKIIEKAYKSEKMTERIKMEQQGIKDLKRGAYVQLFSGGN